MKLNNSIKLGIVVSTQPTKFSALRYNENLETEISKIAELGYDGIELAVREPGLLNVDEIKRLLKKYKLKVPAIGTGQAFVEEGLSFTDASEKKRRSAIARIKSHIDLAKGLDTSVIIGLIRGRGDSKGISKRKQLELMKCALKECVLYAAPMGVNIYIEPLNRYETLLINTITEGVELIKELSFKNFKLLIDTFHMNIEEPSIFGSIMKAMPYIGHVHFADSNRHAPGTGHIGFLDIVNLLFQAGYSGYISMEMLPLPTSDKAAEMSITHLKKIIENIT